MRSIYLEGWYRGYYYSLRDYAPRLGYAVVSFDLGRYWDSYYRDRPFYRERGKWGGSYGEGWTDRANFYTPLEPYGDWIWLQGQYVWVPENVGPRWRPYTVGRWAYTERYGWMWVSREPFGWATYHYGRWGFSNRVGWFWVPGSRWAPAWVSWRRSDDYLAWAPLPPTADEGLSLNISVGTIPDYYWQVVPDRDFLSDDLPDRIVRDRNRYDPILRRSESLGNVTVVNNNVVVNNVVNLNYVEEKTKRKVVVHKVERTKDESKAKGKDGKAEGASIEVFEPPAAPEAKIRAPRKPKRIEEVAKESKTREQAEGAPSTDELLVPAEIKKPLEAEAEAKPVAPPPPAEGETPPAAATEEAAPPPPPPVPSEETVPPSAAETEEATPPAKPAEEAAPPPPPPPPPAKEAVPPPVEEAVPPPPPPPPPAEETEPKGKQDGKPKFKREKGEKAEPEAVPPPPPPPPQEESPTPPPPVSDGGPKPKRDGKPKFNKDKGETGESFAPPPSPPEEMAPPPAPVEGAGPKIKRDGKPKRGKGAPPAVSCPEGMVPLEDGSCGPTQ
jgi:hypothetical protein